MNDNYFSHIRIYPSFSCRHHGTLIAGMLRIPCSLGKAGTTYDKREGDLKTPIGRFRVLSGFYRADKRPRPKTGIVMRPLHPKNGWCDDILSPRYNKPILVPAISPVPISHEKMWRIDHLYDVVIDIGHNRRPPIKGRGSAVFLHLSRPGFTPTRGCIAVDYNSMCKLLKRIGSKTIIEIIGSN